MAYNLHLSATIWHEHDAASRHHLRRRHSEVLFQHAVDAVTVMPA